MKELTCDIFITGTGAAGMAAALSACHEGADVILAEHDDLPGGILNRCIHQGFGLGYFGEDLTGQEYAARFRDRLRSSDVRLFTGTTVLSVSDDRTALMTSADGLHQVHFSACILASGSTERNLSSIPVAGTRPAGVLTAGCLQGMMNLGGYTETGDHIVILGSGNVGQIMGRQLIRAGKTVIAMIEQEEHPGGLARNHRECIEAYHIPLRLHSTITEIHGTDHISAVTVKDLHSGKTEILKCDTLITALGLIPDRSPAAGLYRNGTFPGWLSLCGNCDTIYDIADSLTAQAEQTGKRVCRSLSRR